MLNQPFPRKASPSSPVCDPPPIRNHDVRSAGVRGPRHALTPSSASPSILGATVRFSNNQLIFNEGDEATHFYKVVSGWIRLYKMRSDGHRQIIDLLMPGTLSVSVTNATRSSLTPAARSLWIATHANRSSD